MNQFKKQGIEGDIDENRSDNYILDAKQAIKRTYAKEYFKSNREEEPEIAIEIVNENIQKDKQVKQALVAEHLFRKTIEDAIPAGIAGFDTQLNQIYVNSAFCNMLGYTEQELINTHFPQKYWPLCSGDDSSENHEKITTIMSSTNPVEILLHGKNNKRMWGWVTGNVLLDSEGSSIGRLISVADISKQKFAEHTLKELSTKLINSQESERKSIAQDLHDSIGGKLTGIKYGLERVQSTETIDADEGKALIESIIVSVMSTLDEIQKIIKDLRPSILDDLGLIPAIRDYCREFNQFYPMINIDLDFRIEDKEIPKSITIVIYRFFQEAMNNVAKHSNAKKVNILLKKNSKSLILEICDNGVGFKIDDFNSMRLYSDKFGIDNMRERAELFGGKFQLKTRINYGTSILGSWPMVDL